MSQPPTELHSPLARRRIYALLSRLFLAEPDAFLLDELEAMPGFNGVLPAREERAEWLEEEAAEHQWLLGMNAYPYESLYTDRELMLNTEAAGQMAAFYRECGFDASSYSVGAPDHLGVELALMSRLAGTEHLAGQRHEADTVEWARTMQARMLREHLARWAPVYCATVQRIARRPLHRLLAKLTARRVLSDLELFPSSPVEGAGDVGEAAPSTAPGDDQEPGLNSIVRRLLTPADVGVFLTRADIARLASSLELPSPVADRLQMLRGLFAAAGQFGLLPALLAGLHDLFSAEAARLQEMVTSQPGWAPYGEIWQRCLQVGTTLLTEMQQQAREANSPGGA